VDGLHLQVVVLVQTGPRELVLLEENIKQWGEKREEQIHFTNNLDNNDSRNAYARECGLSAKNIRLEGPRLTMKLKLN